jgi:2-oxoglutarate ferredoxin oxidoreductase subunit delta
MPPKGRIEVDEKYCKGCEMCVNACTSGSIRLAVNRLNAKGYHPAEMIEAGCTGCGVCAIVCPEAAIAVYREITNKQVSV